MKVDSITKMDSNALLCLCVSNIVLQEWYLFSRIFLGRKKNQFHKIIRILAASIRLESCSYLLLRTIHMISGLLCQDLDERCSNVNSPLEAGNNT